MKKLSILLVLAGTFVLIFAEKKNSLKCTKDDECNEYFCCYHGMCYLADTDRFLPGEDIPKFMEYVEQMGGDSPFKQESNKDYQRRVNCTGFKVEEKDKTCNDHDGCNEYFCCLNNTCHNPGMERLKKGESYETFMEALSEDDFSAYRKDVDGDYQKRVDCTGFMGKEEECKDHNDCNEYFCCLKGKCHNPGLGRFLSGETFETFTEYVNEKGDDFSPYRQNFEEPYEKKVNCKDFTGEEED